MREVKVGDKVSLKVSSEYYGSRCKIEGVATITEVMRGGWYRAKDEKGNTNAYKIGDLEFHPKYKIGDVLMREKGTRFDGFSSQLPTNTPYKVVNISVLSDMHWYAVTCNGLYLSYPEDVLVPYEAKVKSNDDVTVDYTTKIKGIEGVVLSVTNGVATIESVEDQVTLSIGVEHCKVKPKPAQTLLTIPWDVIDEQYKFAAMDADGQVFFYEDEPRLTGKDFVMWEDFTDGDCTAADLLKIDTKDIVASLSLTKRGE